MICNAFWDTYVLGGVSHARGEAAVTTVVAIARHGQVVMGADRATSVYDRPVLSAVKIRRVVIDPDLGQRGELLVGFSGDGALANLVQRHLTVSNAPTQQATVTERTLWADGVAEAITAIARDFGVTDDGHLDGTGILAHDGHVWTIAHAQTIHHPDGIAAIGSGEGPAIGAVDVMVGTTEDPTLDLTAVVSVALMVAINRDKHSAGDPDIHTLG